MKYTRAFHLLERSFFCEGVTNKKTHFSRARSLRLHGPARFALLRDPFRKPMPSPPLHSERKNHPLTVPLPLGTQSGDCGDANVMWPCILQSKQVMPFAFAVKGIPFGKASLKLKRKANCIRAGSFSPLPLLPSSRNGLTASLLLNPLTPYKEVIFNREDSIRGHRGCTRGPQPRYGLAVLPMILLSRTNARPSERDLDNRFSCNLTERRLL